MFEQPSTTRIMKSARSQQASSQGHHQMKLKPRSHRRLVVLLIIGSCLAVTSTLGQLTEEESSTSTSGPSGTSLAPITIAPNVDHFEPTPSPNGSSSTASKLKPVNFTLVDEIFAASLSDDELVKRWRNMDAQIQEGVRSILKLVFPQIVAISQDAKVSGDCSGGILKWILSLRNLRSWAIKMLDATGKPNSGIFEGSLTMFGNYRQCLNIRAPDEDEIEITDQFEEYFRGQFCVIHLKPWLPAKKPFYHLNSTIEPLLRKNYKYYEKTLYDELAEIAIAFQFIDIRLDLCVPSTCTVADIQRVAELLSRKMEMRAKVMRCDTSPRDISSLRQLDQLASLWLLLPLTLALVVLLATILVATGVSTRVDQSQATADAAAASGQSTRGEPTKYLARILDCLSVQGSLRSRFLQPGEKFGPHHEHEHDDFDQEASIFNKSNSGRRAGSAHSGHEEANQDHPSRLANYFKRPLPLYGLRSLFVLWFLLVQMTVELKYQFLRESLVLRNMMLAYWPYQILINSTPLFESLIIITAFTFSYSNLETSLRELVLYILDKYIRLIPPIVSLIALTIMTPSLNIESPVWKNFVDDQANTCRATGYVNLFFLQNFIGYEKICLPHSWLFCVELQLIVLSVPLLLLLKRTFAQNEDSFIIAQSNHIKSSSTGPPTSRFCISLNQLIRTQAGLLGLLLICTGSLVNFSLVYTNQLPASWFYTFPDVDQKNYYFGKYLAKTWTHLTPFFVGLYAGYLCRSTIQLNSVRYLGQLIGSSPASSSASSTILSDCPFSTQQQKHRLQHEHEHQQQQVAAHQSPGRKGTALITSGLMTCAAVSMFAIIFSTHSWSTGEGPSPLVAALYDSLSRLSWSLALVTIMIQLCLPRAATSNYSSLARFLSHPFCILVGRLSFLAYLVSPYVNTFVLAVEDQPLFPSLFLIFHVIVGNIVITYLIAFILAIVIEQPIRQLLCNLFIRPTYSSGRMTIIPATILTTTQVSRPTSTSTATTTTLS